MAVFAVTYDLNKQKDYPKLWDAFDAVDSHKALRSFYLISVNNTAQEVINHFTKFIDQDDLLLAAKLDQKPRFHQAFKGTQAWIDSHF